MNSLAWVSLEVELEAKYTAAAVVTLLCRNDSRHCAGGAGIAG